MLRNLFPKFLVLNFEWFLDLSINFYLFDGASSTVGTDSNVIIFIFYFKEVAQRLLASALLAYAFFCPGFGIVDVVLAETPVTGHLYFNDVQIFGIALALHRNEM